MPFASVVHLQDPLGDADGLRPLIRVTRYLDLALAVGFPRDQVLVRVGALFLRQGVHDAVGSCEDARARPEVRV